MVPKKASTLPAWKFIANSWGGGGGLKGLQEMCSSKKYPNPLPPQEGFLFYTPSPRKFQFIFIHNASKNLAFKTPPPPQLGIFNDLPWVGYELFPGTTQCMDLKWNFLRGEGCPLPWWGGGGNINIFCNYTFPISSVTLRVCILWYLNLTRGQGTGLIIELTRDREKIMWIRCYSASAILTI